MRRDDLDDDEYQSMKDDTLDQIKEFTSTLDRMNKGDIGLNNAFSVMRKVKTNWNVTAERLLIFFFFRFYPDDKTSDSGIV